MAGSNDAKMSRISSVKRGFLRTGNEVSNNSTALGATNKIENDKVIRKIR